MNVAIILAAGESRRMGQPKQLLPFGNKTMLECVISAFFSQQVDEIRVVLGHQAEKIGRKIGVGFTTPSTSRDEARKADTLMGLPPAIYGVKNPRYQHGMFTSVQAGLRGLPAQAKLVMIALCDQPRLQRATVEELIGHFEAEHHKILVPVYEGHQGHPLLFRAEYAKEILAMDESLTLKHFLAAHAEDIARLPTQDEGVLIDIDDRTTYERELRR